MHSLQDYLKLEKKFTPEISFEGSDPKLLSWKMCLPLNAKICFVYSGSFQNTVQMSGATFYLNCPHKSHFWVLPQEFWMLVTVVQCVIDKNLQGQFSSLVNNFSNFGISFCGYKGKISLRSQFFICWYKGPFTELCPGPWPCNLSKWPCLSPKPSCCKTFCLIRLILGY